MSSRAPAYRTAAPRRKKKGMTTFFATSESWRGLVQRLVLAFVVFAHGGQKLFGWWGGYGYEGTMGYFASLGVPAAMANLVILTETAGMLALAAGFATRLVAGGLSLIMLGAIVLQHAQFGFFMNWGGNLGGEGFELHLLALALSVPLALTGAGKLSVDGLIAQRLHVGRLARA